MAAIVYGGDELKWHINRSLSPTTNGSLSTTSTWEMIEDKDIIYCRETESSTPGLNWLKEYWIEMTSYDMKNNL